MCLYSASEDFYVFRELRFINKLFVFCICISSRLLPPKLPKYNNQVGWDLVNMEAIMNLVLRRRVRQPSSFFNFADPVIKWWVALSLKNIPRSSKRYLIPLMFTLCPFANFLIELGGIFFLIFLDFYYKSFRTECMGLLWATTVLFAVNCTSLFLFLIDVKHSLSWDDILSLNYRWAMAILEQCKQKNMPGCHFVYDQENKDPLQGWIYLPDIYYTWLL